MFEKKLYFHTINNKVRVLCHLASPVSRNACISPVMLRPNPFDEDIGSVNVPRLLFNAGNFVDRSTIFVPREGEVVRAAVRAYTRDQNT